jgi:RHS repeat-associated protein
MRRYLAAILMLLMVSQSSGAAVAANSGPSGRAFSLAAVVNPVRSLVSGSRIYASLTGTGDLYNAVHAPAPAFHRPEKHLDAAAVMRSSRALRPRVREGVRRIIVMPSRSELDPRHHRLDPLAMRPSKTKPKTTALDTLQPFLLQSNQSTSGAAPPRGSGRLSARRQSGGVKPQTSSSDSGAGIEHWFDYQERAIPGIGKAMLNVGTGNLVVSAMDVDLHEKGIDLAFQRVYNMQSLHDYSGDDGGDSAIFGNRWTNNFDASIVYNSSANTITVYDLDGTPCTYTSNGSGVWAPCTGEYATLAPTDASDCTYAWTKTNGTVYWFHTDGGTIGFGCTGLTQAKRGRIQEIFARNQNNYITFAYSYDGNGTTSEDITKIVVNHNDGDLLVMRFGLIAGSINELATITRPDNAVIQYSYDTSGNLLEVDRPGNNSATTVPANPNNQITVPTGDIPETYAYVSGTSSLQEACGPRCTVAMWNNPNNPTDGGALLFTVNGSLQLTSWQFNGVLNFTPDDGQTQPLQSGYSTQFTNWYTANFVYGSNQTSQCGATLASTTTMCDSDGHGLVWTTDTVDRVTQTQEWAGTAENIWIATSQQWDSNNNLIWTKDANLNKTQYGYDVAGDALEVQQPAVTDIYNQSGSYNPLSLYNYDGFHNVIAYCDPVYNQTHGNVWTDTPVNPMCIGTGKAMFTFTQPTIEPFGCLTNMQKFGGYNTAINYGGNCGVGLPTSTMGDTVTQNDQSTRTPTQDFAYGANGNLTSYDKGSGSHGLQDSWTVTYDDNNRLKTATQNDSQITNAALTSLTCYYPDDSVFFTETPSQYAADSSPSCPSTSQMLAGSVSPQQHATAHYYDLDGDEIETVTHKGCSAATHCPGAQPIDGCTANTSGLLGTTCKYYDGMDRLVETAEPYDKTRTTQPQSGGTQPYEFYGFRWMNRYIYDLSEQSGTLTIADTTGTTPSFVAYGGLYKTQECLHGSRKLLALSDATAWNGYTSCTFDDIRGSSIDALGRTVAKYELAYGTTAVSLNSYDCSGQLDLLCVTTNAVNQTITYLYDNVGRVKQESFGGPNPQADGPRSFTFDADGRTASIAAGLGTISYYYDVDGNRLKTLEPSSEDGASLICYDYYSDGLRKYLSIGTLNASCGSIPSNGNPSNHGISQQNLLSYLYTNAGMLTTESVNWNGLPTKSFNWTYTPSLREYTESDPLTGSEAFLPPFYTSGTTMSAKSYTYDPYGRVSEVVLPGGFSESTLVYDTDDELVGYNAGINGGSNGPIRQMTLNSRGELLQDINQWGTYSANGTLIGNGNSLSGVDSSQSSPNGMQFDVRSGMITAITNPFYGQAQGQSYGAGEYVYNYDAAGRQTTATEYPSWPTLQPSDPGYTTSYDTENHISQTGNVTNLCRPNAVNCLDGTNTAAATWGPDGHQRIVTEAGVTTTAHWDGDTLLFGTGYGTDGAPKAFLYIGKYGVMDSSGDIYVADRDQTGEQQTDHGYVTSWPTGPTNGIWYDSWSIGNTRNVFIAKENQYQSFNFFKIDGSCGYTSYGSNPPTTYLCPGFYPTFTMERPDGYNMVGGYVQGARTFDPTTGQWLTPDAYAGSVHDPMSQKPFMYNNNNPVAWSDPTGYIGGPACAYLKNCTTPSAASVVISIYNLAIGDSIRTLGDSHANILSRLVAGIGLASIFLGPVGRAGGKATEIVSGVISESGFLRSAIEFLGAGSREVGSGRYLSADGLRQLRFGSHETRDASNLHAHFETYDKPASQGGRVDESSTVDIVPDDAGALAPNGVPTIKDLFQQHLHNQVPP